MTPVIKTPERWPTLIEKVREGLYDTTLDKASTLLRRGISTGFLHLDGRGRSHAEKSAIYSSGPTKTPCVLEVCKLERVVSRYNWDSRSHYTTTRVELDLTFWSIGKTGITARHIQRVKDGIGPDDLRDPLEAALLGRFLTIDELEAALHSRAA